MASVCSYRVIARIVITTGLYVIYNPVVSFDLRCQSDTYIVKINVVLKEPPWWTVAPSPSFPLSLLRRMLKVLLFLQTQKDFFWV